MYFQVDCQANYYNSLNSSEFDNTCIILIEINTNNLLVLFGNLHYFFLYYRIYCNFFGLKHRLTTNNRFIYWKNSQFLSTIVHNRLVLFLNCLLLFNCILRLYKIKLKQKINKKKFFEYSSFIWWKHDFLFIYQVTLFFYEIYHFIRWRLVL